MPDVFIKMPNTEILEGSSFIAQANFRDGETGTAPTTADYRIDCVTTGKNIKGWTSLTPAASIDITITATDNALQDQGLKIEKRQITVSADRGTSTEKRNIISYHLKNIRGF